MHRYSEAILSFLKQKAYQPAIKGTGMKITKANCGASVKAAGGGYIKNNKMKPQKAGKAAKEQSDMDDRSKYAKRADGVKAYKGGMAKKKGK